MAPGAYEAAIRAGCGHRRQDRLARWFGDGPERAPDALCGPCRAEVRRQEANEGATDTVAGGITREAAVRAYRDLRSQAANQGGNQP